MLTSLRAQGFRGFRSFEKSGFGRVNLLVGRNNAGKTRLLEAIELLLRGDTVNALYEQPLRRSEKLPPPPEEPSLLFSDVRHLFTGHALSPGKRLILEGSAGDAQPLRVEIEVHQVPRNGQSPPGWSRPAGALYLTCASAENGGEICDLTPSGGLFRGPSLRAKTWRPVSFLAASEREGISYVEMWEDLVLTATETDVLRAVQIVEPAVERIAVAHDGFVIRVSGSDDRLPIGAMGDGARHVLALAIHLAKSAGGALLVDEIDNGLHYSVMRPVWRFLIEAARRLGVQIFATSHSLDCLQALAAVTEEVGITGDEVQVHRLESGVETTTSYSAEELRVAVAQEMEIR